MDATWEADQAAKRAAEAEPEPEAASGQAGAAKLEPVKRELPEACEDLLRALTSEAEEQERIRAALERIGKTPGGSGYKVRSRAFIELCEDIEAGRAHITKWAALQLERRYQLRRRLAAQAMLRRITELQEWPYQSEAAQAPAEGSAPAGAAGGVAAAWGRL